MSEIPRALEGGWKRAYYHEELGGDEHGVAVFVKIPRELGDEDTWGTLRKASEDILSALHVETLRLKPETAEQTAVEKARILGCFRERIYAEPVPNGYCSRWCCHFRPWYVVTTPMGRIKIGWRKRVLHLEWTDSLIAQTAAQLFPTEDVTRFDRVIHCHGYDKAAQYIDVLMRQGVNP